MAKARRTFTDEERREYVNRIREAIAEGKGRSRAAREAGVADSVYVRWEKQLAAQADAKGRAAPKKARRAKPAKRKYKKYKARVFTDDSGNVISRQRWNGLETRKALNKAAAHDRIKEENVYLRKRLGEMLIELELLNRG